LDPSSAESTSADSSILIGRRGSAAIRWPDKFEMLKSLGVPLFVVLAIAVGWHVAKWYRPTNEYVRHRTSDPGWWERAYPTELALLVRKVLGTIQTAFLLRHDDVDRLRPSDQLAAMYRAAYPKRWQADTLEFETLHADLRRKYHIPEPALSTLWEMTVNDIIQLSIAHQRDAG
jgi:hypothetical protein